MDDQIVTDTMKLNILHGLALRLEFIQVIPLSAFLSSAAKKLNPFDELEMTILATIWGCDHLPDGA